VGETLIWIGLPAVHALARGAVLRFMVFDASGLILLIFALFLVNAQRKRVMV